MTPQEREEALSRREENAAILSAKLERDRVALESEISTAAAASKAASAINRALQSDAAKKVKELEAEGVLWEAKLARLKGEVGKAAPAPVEATESPAEKAAAAAEKAQVAADRAALEAQKAAFERESTEARARLKTEAQALAELRAKLVTIRSDLEASVKTREADVKKKEASIEAERAKLQSGVDSLMRAEAQQAEQRAKHEAQVAALAAKEVMYEERNRQLQERLKNFAKA
jgi:N-acetylmuramoyl-L-alanine amidase CwlA